MIKHSIATIAIILCLSLHSFGERELSDVSKPDSRYQVITRNDIGTLYESHQAVLDMQTRLDSIDASIKSLSADVRSLMNDNILYRFFLACSKYLISGFVGALIAIWANRFFRERQKPA